MRLTKRLSSGPTVLRGRLRFPEPDSAQPGRACRSRRARGRHIGAAAGIEWNRGAFDLIEVFRIPKEIPTVRLLVPGLADVLSGSGCSPRKSAHQKNRRINPPPFEQLAITLLSR